MKKQYPYLQDRDFLREIDTQLNTEQWVKITLLDYDKEIPLSSIEGEITSGTLNKDGSSAVRRTLSLSCNIDAFTYDPEDVTAKYSISKKVFLELGVTNNTNQYTDYDIVWMPQGVFFITSFSITNSSSGALSISLNFKDKMAKLDGTLGGTLPATTRFDTTTSLVNGNYYTTKALVYDIIMEAVNHFGGESLTNIIIDDVPLKIKRIVRWNDTSPVWIYPVTDIDTGEISYDICHDSDLDEKESAHTPLTKGGALFSAEEYVQNQDMGYVYEDFVYDDELSLDAGSKVTDLLDKIKTWLGNYEYFYDEYGQFHFQEIKNYLNNSQSSYAWDKITSTTDKDYLYETTRGKAVYTFDDSENLVSVTNTPSYENIKNDFIVEGTNTTNNIKTTVRYHLVIDDKPEISNDGYSNILLYKDPSSSKYVLGYPTIIDPTKTDDGYVWQLPEFGEDGKVYGLIEEPQLYTFSDKLKTQKEFVEYYNGLVQEEKELQGRITTLQWGSGIKHDLILILMNSALKNLTSTDDVDLQMQLAKELIVLVQWYNWHNFSNYYGTHDLVNGFPESAIYYAALGKLSSKKWSVFIKTKTQTLRKQITLIDSVIRMLFTSKLISDTLPVGSMSSYSLGNIYFSVYNKELTEMGASLSNKQLKSFCQDQLERVAWKQEQGQYLGSYYDQLISNYSALLAPFSRKTSLTQEEEKWKEIYENEQSMVIQEKNNIDAQAITMAKRIDGLYATLTFLGESDEEAGDIYITYDTVLPAFISSFWYYDTDDTKDTYGWNELTWETYWHEKTSPPKETSEDGREIYSSYYHNGLAPLTYIDFNDQSFWDNYDYSISESINEALENLNISINEIEGDNSQYNYLSIDNDFFKLHDSGVLTTGDAITSLSLNSKIGEKHDSHYSWCLGNGYPSMNRHSPWYKNFYVDYAKKKDLPYLGEDDGDTYVSKDWRVELIVRGMQAQETGADAGYYYQELAVNWANVYDFQNDYLIPSAITDLGYYVDSTGVMINLASKFYKNGETENNLAKIDESVGSFVTNDDNSGELKIVDYGRKYSNTDYHYFFDMIDSSSPRWGGYSVNNIGRRTNVNVSDSVNCIFAPDTPNYAFINVSNMSNEERAEALAELQGVAENIIQVTDEFYNNFVTGGLKQSAYDQIKYDLQQYTSYQNTVSITARPSFYLEPNVRIYMYDQSTGTIGDYVLKTISIPLGSTGNTMSATLSKALEKI